MKLFDPESATDGQRPKRSDETIFEFCSRVQDPRLQEGREISNRWFSRYPTSMQEALARRLRARRDDTHYGAFFELQLFGMLTEFGLCVEPLDHSDTDGVSAPDFRVHTAGDPCLLEATVRMDTRDDRVFTFLQTVTSQVQKVEPRLRIWVHECDSTTTAPSARQFSRMLIQQYRESINLKLLTDAGRRKLTRHICSHEQSGWRFDYTIWRSESTSPPKSTIQMVGPIESYWTDTEATLRSQIASKIRQHSDHREPLVVAIAWNDRIDTLEDADILGALSADKDGNALSLHGTVISSAASVWSAHSAKLELWISSDQADGDLASNWPFAMNVFDVEHGKLVRSVRRQNEL